MKKSYDWLLRNTYFLPWGKLDADAAIKFCLDNGFGHLMLGEDVWCKTFGWYESLLPGGHAELKAFIKKCHDAGLIFTLHGRNMMISANDPLAVDPCPQGLVPHEDYCFIHPDSDLQKQVSARFIALADMIGADGIFFDGADIYSCYARTLSDPAEKQKAAAKILQTAFDCLTRPMMLSGSITNPEPHRDYLCFSGRSDTYPTAKDIWPQFTRETWTEKQIELAQEALNVGFVAQVGWIDFCSGKTAADGTAIEDQTPESMGKLCTWAQEHNCPIVLESTLDAINAHPRKDAILEVIRGMKK